MTARAIAPLVAAFVIATASSAGAQQRVVVLPFEGPMSNRARDAVVDALDGGGYALVSLQEVELAAERSGAALSEPAGRAAVARELQLAAFVAGDARKRGAKISVQLTVYDGASGEVLGEAKVSARKPALVRTMRRRTLDEIGGALSRATAPEPAKPEPAAAEAPRPAPPRAAPKPRAVEPKRVPKRERVQAPEERAAAEQSDVETPDYESAAEPEEAPEPRPIALELGLSVRVSTREMTYRDALIQLGQSSYSATPVAALGLRWYPGAHFGSGAGAHIGIEASGQLMYPIDTTHNAIVFRTTSHVFGAGLHGRLPLGPHELGLGVGYGRHTVELADGEGGIDPGVPSVSYGFGRAGLDARFAFGELLGLRAGGGYRLLLSYGELAEDAWFRHTGGGGVDAEIALRFTVAKPLVLEAGVAFVRYFLSLRPEPSDQSVIDDARIAGGITDQYLLGGLGIVLEL